MKEPDYSNNTATRNVQVDAEPSVPLEIRSGGGTSSIIVPDDCVVNPDPTSRQPCVNYPNLILP